MHSPMATAMPRQQALLVNKLPPLCPGKTQAYAAAQAQMCCI